MIQAKKMYNLLKVDFTIFVLIYILSDNFRVSRFSLSFVEFFSDSGFLNNSNCSLLSIPEMLTQIRTPWYKNTTNSLM